MYTVYGGFIKEDITIIIDGSFPLTLIYGLGAILTVLPEVTHSTIPESGTREGIKG